MASQRKDINQKNLLQSIQQNQKMNDLCEQIAKIKISKYFQCINLEIFWSFDETLIPY